MSVPNYPYNYIDMGSYFLYLSPLTSRGNYNVLTWLPSFLTEPRWTEQLYFEPTSDNTSQLITSFFVPVFMSGTYIGSFGAVACCTSFPLSFPGYFN